MLRAIDPGKSSDTLGDGLASAGGRGFFPGMDGLAPGRTWRGLAGFSRLRTMNDAGSSERAILAVAPRGEKRSGGTGADDIPRRIELNRIEMVARGRDVTDLWLLLCAALDFLWRRASAFNWNGFGPGQGGREPLRPSGSACSQMERRPSASLTPYQSRCWPRSRAWCVARARAAFALPGPEASERADAAGGGLTLMRSLPIPARSGSPRAAGRVKRFV